MRVSVEDEHAVADTRRPMLVRDRFAVDVARTGVDAFEGEKIDQPCGRSVLQTIRGAGYRLATDGG